MRAVVTCRRTTQRRMHVRRGRSPVVPAVKPGGVRRAGGVEMIYASVLRRLSLLPRGVWTVHPQQLHAGPCRLVAHGAAPADGLAAPGAVRLCRFRSDVSIPFFSSEAWAGLVTQTREICKVLAV